MGTLNPSLISQQKERVLTTAVEIIKANHKRVIYPEAVLLALIRSKDTAARRILDYYQEQRGLNPDRLDRSVRVAVETRRDTDGDLRFSAVDGEQIPMSRQMIVGLDEALRLAKAANAAGIDSDHMLAIMAEAKISTGGLLRQHGITPSALSDLMGGKSGAKQNAPTTDMVAEAKKGSVRAVYFREVLLRDLTNMLSQKVNRHVILIGPDGVGKRTLAYSLGLQMAEAKAGKGPVGLTKLVTVEETALLDNPVQAIQNGLNQARGGVLFIPHIERFFGGPGRADFARAVPNIHKALLSDNPVIIGTAKQAHYDKRSANASGVSDHVQRLKVPEVAEAAAIEILKVLAPHIASDYTVTISDDAIKTAVQLAKRYMSPGIPLPRSAEHLMHRAAAMVNVSRQASQQEQGTGDSTLDAE